MKMWQPDVPAWLRPRTEDIFEIFSRSSCFNSFTPFRRKLPTAFLGVFVFLLVAAMVFSHTRPFRDEATGGLFGHQGALVYDQPTVPPFNETAAKNLEKPPGFQVVALVFYGRRDRVSILDCYLQRNLVRNGGVLDEVLFLTRTDNQDDLDWLDRKVEQTEGYRKTDTATVTGNKTVSSVGLNFSDMWGVVRRGIMYVKIDDDVLFIEDAAIPSIVHRRLQRPEAFVVSANIVSHNRFTWLHRKLGAVLPYLPESKSIRTPQHGKSSKYEWRASALPTWPGDPHRFNRNSFRPPRHHRWLPVRNANIDNTPIVETQERAGTAATFDWMVAAQEHYSFLHRLESNDLDAYRFPMWDFSYEGMSINFIAIWGDDVVLSQPIGKNDEEYLTETAPRALGRHVIADGRALVAHLSYRKQHDGLEKTDILDRYRVYADENICPKNKP